MPMRKMMKRWWLVVPGMFLLSAVTWGQSWGPRGSVVVQFGAPVRYVQVDRHWDDDRRWDDRRWDDRSYENRDYEARRWERDRAWREHQWREHERREAWERRHRREEWRESHPYYRGY